MVRSLLILMLALALLASVALARRRVDTPGVPGQGPGWGSTAAPKGVVSVARPLAAEVGAEMLAKGGNAIDAAAAVQFALNDGEPKMTGIGGSAFIIIYLAKQKKVFVIDLQTGRVFSAADPRRDSTVIYGKGGENNLAKPKK